MSGGRNSAIELDSSTLERGSPDSSGFAEADSPTRERGVGIARERYSPPWRATELPYFVFD